VHSQETEEGLPALGSSYFSESSGAETRSHTILAGLGERGGIVFPEVVKRRE